MVEKQNSWKECWTKIERQIVTGLEGKIWKTWMAKFEKVQRQSLKSSKAKLQNVERIVWKSGQGSKAKFEKVERQKLEMIWKFWKSWQVKLKKAEGIIAW